VNTVPHMLKFSVFSHSHNSVNCKLERVCSQTQLCPLRCFNDYTRQLHVLASTGHLQVVFKRTYGPTVYIVCTRDGEISISGLEIHKHPQYK